MNNFEKAKKDLQERIERIDYFFEYLDSQNEIVPHAKKIKEKTQWELETLEKLPEELRSKINDDFVNHLYDTTTYIDKSLPTPQSIYVNSMSAMATSDSTNVINFILQFDSKRPEINYWAVAQTSKYRELQKKQEIEREIFKKLKILNNDIADRFKKSLDEFEKALALENISSNIANNFRNTLYKVRGEIWDSVKKPNEQKLDWGKITERVSVEGTGTVERAKLREMETLYNNLHDNLLSPMDKDRFEFSKEKIEQAKTMYLDYLYTIVNLIKFA